MIERVARGAPSTLFVTFYGDEAPVDADGNVDVLISRADGTTLLTGTATHASTGVYTYVLPAQAALNVLTVEWTGTFNGEATTITSTVEVVGGQYFSIAELRAVDTVLQNKTKYPFERLVAARLAVEAEFEGICGRAFVPRYARERLIGDGSGVLWLANPDPLRPVSLTVDDADWSDQTLGRRDDNLRTLVLDSGTFPYGSKIVIEYEYGMDVVPIRIRNAGLKRAKYALVADQSRIDERATTMNIPDFGNFILATPGIRGSYTGIPEVDVVLQDYQIGSL